MREALIYYAYKYQGEYSLIKKALANKEVYKILSYSDDLLTIYDKNYPKAFFNLQNPPFVIFYKGNLHLLNNPKLGIIGSRNPDDYGIYLTKLLASYIKPNYTIVSGLAKGIDYLAHSLMEEKHDCIGIVGSGLNYHYPYSSRELWNKIANQHLLLSEYPPNSKPLKHHFLMRNRLIAALSNKLVVVQAGLNSGSLNTVSEAICLNQEIYTFPTNIDNKLGYGNNLLIEQGCNLLSNINDIKDL